MKGGFPVYSARDEKKELRKHCAALRDGLEEEVKRAADQRILRLLCSLSSYRFAPAVLLYAPIKSEIDVTPLMEAVLSSGKILALPLCEKEPGIMTFRQITDVKELQKGQFGVKEPPQDAPLLPHRLLKDKSALLVVPALAFDKKGYRLGYGKGYYDKFMNVFRGSTIGVAYTSQILPSLPRGRFDKHCDALVTEKGIKPLKPEKK